MFAYYLLKHLVKKNQHIISLNIISGKLIQVCIFQKT